ncbi:hypothetical protein CWI60_04270 [Neisseria meningitidis]|nr:hypothetical protein CWI60_04270 [Neisseria meningitidis]
MPSGKPPHPAHQATTNKKCRLNASDGIPGKLAHRTLPRSCTNKHGTADVPDHTVFKAFCKIKANPTAIRRSPKNILPNTHRTRRRRNAVSRKFKHHGFRAAATFPFPCMKGSIKVPPSNRFSDGI